MSNTLNAGDIAPSFSLTDASGHTVTLGDFEGQQLMIKFTRYTGCPVCQMDTIAYAKDYQLVKDQGMELIVIFQSSAEKLAEYTQSNALPYIALSDTQRTSYKSYGVKDGLKGFLAVSNLRPMLKSFTSGYRHGKFEGNELQYPASFILDAEHKVIQSHYGKTVTDSISIPELLKKV